MVITILVFAVIYLLIMAGFFVYLPIRLLISLVKSRRRRVFKMIALFAIAAIFIYYTLPRITIDRAEKIAYTTLLKLGYKSEFIDDMSTELRFPGIVSVPILNSPKWLVTCKYSDPSNRKVHLMKKYGHSKELQAVNISIYIFRTTGKVESVREWFWLRPREIVNIRDEYILKRKEFSIFNFG